MTHEPLFENGMVFFFVNLESLDTDCWVLSLFEIGQVVLKKKIFNLYNMFSLFRYYRGPLVRQT